MQGKRQKGRSECSRALRSCFIMMLPQSSGIKQAKLQLSGGEDCQPVWCVLHFGWSIAMVWCTLKLTTAPDVFQVKLYSTLCWNFKHWEASDVTQTGSVVLMHSLLCSTTIYQPSHSTTYEWTMSLILPHGKKQVSQPLDWESHSLSCHTPTKWVSFPLLVAAASVGYPQRSLPSAAEKKLTWLEEELMWWLCVCCVE